MGDIVSSEEVESVGDVAVIVEVVLLIVLGVGRELLVRGGLSQLREDEAYDTEPASDGKCTV